ncbi:hypothetical protein CSKR_203544 [Clonorchis sinensis]|uniref:Uncharacterized protein n=1 Tax=Clonorchis sinensis TaxID=79923 RepID=A0A8T1MB86_CLOSI|nr:hypothetical protein CSKR_203544 [Clonorchis sinensis]
MRPDIVGQSSRTAPQYLPVTLPLIPPSSFSGTQLLSSLCSVTWKRFHVIANELMACLTSNSPESIYKPPQIGPSSPNLATLFKDMYRLHFEAS